MESSRRRLLKAVVLELRHLLEGWYDEQGHWHPGDLEQRLAAIGVRRDREPVRLDELPHLSQADRRARGVVEAYLQLRRDAGIPLGDAVAEFVRETAYTWANRLLALRCMEARELIDEVILQKEVYGGRSLEHNRLARKQPDLCAGEDDGLFALLDQIFTRQAQALPRLFDSLSPGIALRPSPAILQDSIGLLSLKPEALSKCRIRQPDAETGGVEIDAGSVFRAPDALGWAYQYWSMEAKERVFERLRTEKGAKIQGADIIPATQLYTEDYMVKFLVQNSLGTLWMGMHPESRLCAGREYYVRSEGAERITAKPVHEITFLDPAMGSAHFHLEAFDLLYAMYEEEGQIKTPRQICAAILNNNLFGIDIDERAVQIGIAALWMKALEKAPDLLASDLNTFHVHFVATNIRLPKGKDHLGAFLAKHPEDKVLGPALDVVFSGLQHVDEIGSLLKIEEPVERELQHLKGLMESRKGQAVQPDMLRPTAEQGELPVGVESFEHWRQKTLSALKQHFAQEAETTDLAQAFFSRNVNKGLALLDCLSAKYDVVATNPPYMHCSNFGETLRSYIYAHYADTSQDLYAAFVVRTVALTQQNGFTSLVAQQSFMFLERHMGLRSYLFSHTTPWIVAHLGPKAFEEIGGEVVNVVLLIFRCCTQAKTVGLFWNLTGASQKPIAMRSGCSSTEHLTGVFRRAWDDFQHIPGSPIAYDVPEHVIERIAADRLEGEAEVPAGMVTGDNSRFVRYWWECRDTRTPYMKGGVNTPWYGNNMFVVDASCEGYSRMRTSRTFRAAGSNLYGRPGITYSSVSSMMRARLMDAGSVWDCGGPVVIPHDATAISWILGLLNSTYAQRVLYALNPTINIKTNDIKRLPVLPVALRPEVGRLTTSAVHFARLLDEMNLLSAQFLSGPCDARPTSLQEASKQVTTRREEIFAILSLIQHRLDVLITQGLELDDQDHSQYRRAFHYLPFVSGLEPRKSIVWSDSIFERFAGWICEERDYQTRKSIDGSASLSERVRVAYEVTGSSDLPVEDDASFQNRSEAEDADIVPCAHESVPESVFEKIAEEVGTHPFSVFLLIKEGRDKWQWRRTSDQQRNITDIFTLIVLRLLGQQWPIEVQNSAPVPNWADRDGIIPMSSGHAEAALVDRVRQRLAAEFGGDPGVLENVFGEMMGVPLNHWLGDAFFKHHVRHFRKRPIAWQVESRANARRDPAFRCLVLYQKADGDLLPKTRSQYVGPLCQRMGTELRGIMDLPAASRNDRQERRRIELEDIIRELRTFDSTLEAITQAGFGPDRLVPKLRQFAVDDAWHCKKGQWLVRLEQQARTEALPQWKDKAATLALHEELPQWIDEAFTQLDQFCTAVGSPPPRAKDIEADPSASSIAASIHDHAPVMLTSAISLACGRWWKHYDDFVLAPIRNAVATARKEMTAVTEEKKTCEDRTRRSELELRRRELKAQVAVLQEQLDAKTEPAKALRQQIEQWSHHDAAMWADELATIPMYDAISSVDGERPPPLTVQDFIRQESRYVPDINDGVRVNIAPLQKAGILAADVLAAKDVDKAIEDRADWRADERRWVREGKLRQPCWWREG